jgi:hypothetical protein
MFRPRTAAIFKDLYYYTDKSSVSHNSSVNGSLHIDIVEHLFVYCIITIKLKYYTLSGVLKSMKVASKHQD